MENKNLTREIIIGRSSECDWTIEHFRVSRKHVKILYNNDCVIVEDLSSKNGIFIEENGEKVKVSEQEFSRDGVIYLGEIVPVVLDDVIAQVEKLKSNKTISQVEKIKKVPTKKRCLSCGFVISFKSVECSCCGDGQRASA